MGKRKGRSEISKTLIDRGAVGRDDETMGEEVIEKAGFFACYLLTSLSPRHKGHTYIGFTVNPRRRIRQHNGEIRCGAWRTKSKRPWEMVLCIYGFPTNVAALQFEWAWQHPVESLAVRKAAATFKSLSGIANKIKLAYTMLTLPAWLSLNLTVNFFSTKHTKHTACCPALPEHMKFQVGTMDELPCYTGNDQDHCDNDVWDDDEECDETGGTQGSIDEGLVDATIHNSAYDQSRFAGTADNDLGEPRDSCIGKEDDRQSFCLNNSLVNAVSSPDTRCYGIAGNVEEGVFGIIEEGNVELNLPTGRQLPTRIAGDKYEPPIKSFIVPSKIEVIDVVSPSTSSNRISSCTKKRRVFTVCPEIIDLTKSPIFI